MSRLVVTLPKSQRLRVICSDTGKVMFINVRKTVSGTLRVSFQCDKSYVINRVDDES